MFIYMERTFIQLLPFSRYLDNLIETGKISKKDFDNFEQELLKNPQSGDVISGLAGVRKMRLKGSNIGKRGGFRVDYLDVPEYGKLYLIVLYPKNVKEDLTEDEKKHIRQLVKQLKNEAAHG